MIKLEQITIETLFYKGFIFYNSLLQSDFKECNRYGNFRYECCLYIKQDKSWIEKMYTFSNVVMHTLFWYDVLIAGD